MRDLTIIESPFATDRELVYLKRCLRDSWDRGELPFASHGFFPLFLNEDDPEERIDGIQAGYMMWEFARQIVFYVDYGMSPGMELARHRARAVFAKSQIIDRRIGKTADGPDLPKVHRSST